MSFEDDVRALARHAGFDVADDEPVTVDESAGWSGWSTWTVVDEWDCFTVRCGGFERQYEAAWNESTRDSLLYDFDEDTNWEDQDVTDAFSPDRLSALSAFLKDVDSLPGKGNA